MLWILKRHKERFTMCNVSLKYPHLAKIICAVPGISPMDYAAVKDCSHQKELQKTAQSNMIRYEMFLYAMLQCAICCE